MCSFPEFGMASSSSDLQSKTRRGNHRNVRNKNMEPERMWRLLKENGLGHDFIFYIIASDDCLVHVCSDNPSLQQGLVLKFLSWPFALSILFDILNCSSSKVH